MKALIYSALTLAACATPTPPAAVDGAALDGTHWILVDQDAPRGLRAPTLSFDGARASGFAGCNEWFAQAANSSGGGLRFNGVGTTRRACPAPEMEIERAFLDKLARTRAVSYGDAVGQTLYLIGDEADSVARFEILPRSEAR